MDHVHHLSTFLANLPLPVIFTFLLSIASVLLAFKLIVLNDDGDKAVRFSIPIPDQCKSGWEGELLEEPSIRVIQQIMKSRGITNERFRLRVRAPYDATAQPMDGYSVS